MKLVYFFGVFIFVSVITSTQTPAWQWKKYITGDSLEQMYSVQQATEVGFIVTVVSLLNYGNLSGNHRLYSYGVEDLDKNRSLTWLRSLAKVSGTRTFENVNKPSQLFPP
jgi:hypothetical protein